MATAPSYRIIYGLVTRLRAIFENIGTSESSMRLVKSHLSFGSVPETPSGVLNKQRHPSTENSPTRINGIKWDLQT